MVAKKSQSIPDVDPMAESGLEHPAIQRGDF